MSVSSTYANALFEAATEMGLKSNELESIENELVSLEALLKGSKPLRAALESPIVSAQERIGVIDGLTKNWGKDRGLELLKRFLVSAVERGRFGKLPEIRKAYRKARLQLEGAVEGTIWSADPMKTSDVEGLAQAFGKKLSKKVVFQMETDSSLLAGMKILINGVTYDGTLRSQLERLRQELAHNDRV